MLVLYHLSNEYDSEMKKEFISIFLLRQKLSSVLAFALLFCFFSCKKDPSTPSYSDYRSPVPQILLDYGCFQKGTYWVYQDSASHILDSVNVSSTNQGTIKTNPDNNHPYYGYYGNYNVYAISSYEGMEYHYWVDQQFSFDKHSQITVDRYSNPNSIQETWLMTDYLVPGQSFLSPSDTYSDIVFEVKYDSIKVLNTYFKNVLVFHDGKNATQGNSPTNFYLAKNIGIVRKEINTPQRVWNLIRFNIVQ